MFMHILSIILFYAYFTEEETEGERTAQLHASGHTASKRKN